MPTTSPADISPSTFPGPSEVRDTLRAFRTPPTHREMAATLAVSFLPTIVVAGVAIGLAPLIPGLPIGIVAWLLYSAVAGTLAVGIWVLAHECGHGAFSADQRVNTVVGLISHSLCLVPYSVWARSHRRHHATTNHVRRGEVFVPRLSDEPKARHPIMTVLNAGNDLVLGWPAHIIGGLTRGPEAASRRLKADDIPSLIGVAVVAGALAWATVEFGLVVIALYAGPYLVMNAWVVLYTRLHHTDVGVDHLDDGEWSFVKGAFSTVDRPYPAWVDVLHHRIGTTHVVHHLDASIGFRHAVGATEAVAERWPELYRYDDTPIGAASWRSWRQCGWARRVSEGVYGFQPR